MKILFRRQLYESECLRVTAQLPPQKLKRQNPSIAPARPGLPVDTTVMRYLSHAQNRGAWTHFQFTITASELSSQANRFPSKLFLSVGELDK